MHAVQRLTRGRDSANQTRRLFALAPIYGGFTQVEAAMQGRATVQIFRHRDEGRLGNRPVACLSPERAKPRASGLWRSTPYLNRQCLGLRFALSGHWL